MDCGEFAIQEDAWASLRSIAVEHHSDVCPVVQWQWRFRGQLHRHHRRIEIKKVVVEFEVELRVGQ